MANEVKQEFLDYISDRDEAYKGKSKKKRQEFQKYADMIKFLDFGLGEKFSYCEEEIWLPYYRLYKAIATSTKYEEEQLDEMAYAFGKKRNMLMHNSLEPFGKCSCCGIFFSTSVYLYNDYEKSRNMRSNDNTGN